MHICAWQSADGRVTSDHCRVTVQWLFSKKIHFAWNVQKTLFDSRPTVAWPPTTVAWPFSDFFQKLSKLFETSKKRCLTVIQPSRDLRPLSRDRSVTFFKNFPNCLKRRKNVVWQSSNGRVTSDHCRVTFSDFFQKFFQLLDTSENSCLTVGRRSRQLRLGWNVEKMLFESQRTVTWRSGSFVPVVFFVRHHILPRRCISRSYSYYYFFPPNSLFTYLLLQEWSHPGNFDIISKLGIGRREFLILAGKFQLIDSLWGKQVPHYKHKRRSTTYLLREIPVKNQESLGRGSTHGKIVG